MRVQKKSYILIVDDNTDSLVAIEATLKSLNQQLILAKSGKEALMQVLKHEFSVILMDAHMPDMDGFEAARLIRSRTKTTYTPIIFMTAQYKDETDISQGYALGAVDYIFKPINPHILHSKIKVFVELFRKSEQTHILQNELKRRLFAEKELKLLTQRTQLILNSAGEGIYGLNLKGTITFANPATAAILKRDLTELIGQSVQIMLPDPQMSWHATPFYKALKNNNPYHNETAFFKKKDATLIPVEYTVTPLQEAPSSRQGLVVIFKDITERARAEKLARQHQHQIQLAKGTRVSMMSEMASALAHELNQPLATIANYTKGSIRRLEASSPNLPEVLNAMKKAAEQSERAGEIVHRIKNFVQKGKLYRKRIDINLLFYSAVSLMEYELQGATIDIKFKLKKSLPALLIDNIQIEQVIINLLRNSIEAMIEAKTIKPSIHIRSALGKNNCVIISVIDNGPGFAKDITDRLLDAYVSTKPYGMGMGLSICRTIIEAHGGAIKTKPLPKGGAWVQFTLPIT